MLLTRRCLLAFSKYASAAGGDKKLAQTAWNFVNDSLLRTTLCLEYPPDVCCAARTSFLTSLSRLIGAVSFAHRSVKACHFCTQECQSVRTRRPNK